MSTPRGIRRRAGRCIVTALIVTVLAGCGVQAESDAHRIARDAVPPELLRTTTTATTLPPSTVTTRPVLQSTLYFVRDDQIARVDRQVDTLPSIADLVALLGQPVPEEAARGLRTAVPQGRLVAAVSVSGGGATIDLDPSFALGEERLRTLAFAQMTYTITTVPGVGLVTYTLGGGPIEVPAGDGSVAPPGPVSRDTYRNLLAP